MIWPTELPKCPVSSEDKGEFMTGEIELPNKPTEAMVLAGGEVLLAACSSERGQLPPWRPFDVAQVAIKVWTAMAALQPDKLEPDASEAAWRAFQDTLMDLRAGSDDETCRCVRNAIVTYLQNVKSRSQV